MYNTVEVKRSSAYFCAKHMFPVQPVVITGMVHVNDCMFEKNKRLS